MVPLVMSTGFAALAGFLAALGIGSWFDVRDPVLLIVGCAALFGVLGNVAVRVIARRDFDPKLTVFVGEQAMQVNRPSRDGVSEHVVRFDSSWLYYDRYRLYVNGVAAGMHSKMRLVGHDGGPAEDVWSAVFTPILGRVFAKYEAAQSASFPVLAYDPRDMTLGLGAHRGTVRYEPTGLTIELDGKREVAPFAELTPSYADGTLGLVWSGGRQELRLGAIGDGPALVHLLHRRGLMALPDMR